MSRNSVLFAFEQLVDEGYLWGRVGSGTYVRDDLPNAFFRRRGLEAFRRRDSMGRGESTDGDARLAMW